MRGDWWKDSREIAAKADLAELLRCQADEGLRKRSRSKYSTQSMKMCGRTLLVLVRVYLQQLDYFLAQFLILIIVRRELDGAVSLIVSFCPRSSGIV